MPTTITIPSAGGGGGAGGRTRLTVNTVYYVRGATSTNPGSNSNNGLANTAGGAWLTIQYAINYVCNNLDLAGFSVTINIADGTYTENLVLPEPTGSNFPYAVQLLGNPTNQDLVIIKGATSAAVVRLLGNGWYLEGLRLKTGTNGSRCLWVHGDGFSLSVGRLSFDNGTTLGGDHHTGGYGLYVDGHSYIKFVVDTTHVYGDLWNAVFYCVFGANVFFVESLVVHDNPTWGIACVDCEFNSFFAMPFGSNSGAANGKRYQSLQNSAILNSSGPFPGSTEGTVADGGIYNGVDSVAVSQYLDEISVTQGAILYRGTTAWVALGAGTAGQFLKSSGPASNPSWDVAPGAVGGEANTGLNVGTGGVGVFKQKSGVTLEFKNINSTSAAITVVNDAVNNEIDITLDPTAATAALNIFSPTLKGLVPLSGGGTANFLRADNTWAAPTTTGTVWGTITGTLSDETELQAALDAKANVSHTHTAAAMPAYTGDVSSPAASTVTTISADAVTNAKLANVPFATIKGRLALPATTGDPADLTTTEVTALLNTFTTLLKGLVPAPATATGKFLRDDGTWVAPSGSSGIVAVVSPTRLLTSAEAGLIFTNEGAPGAVTITLPTAVAGLKYTFISTLASIPMHVAVGAGDVFVVFGTTITGTAIHSTAGGAGTEFMPVSIVAINATQWVLEYIPMTVGGWIMT